MSIKVKLSALIVLLTLTSWAGPELNGTILLGNMLPQSVEQLQPIERKFLSSVVLLISTDFGHSKKSSACTGVLIKSSVSAPADESDLVLTASHCVDSTAIDKIKVQSSHQLAKLLNQQPSTAKVKELWSHESIQKNIVMDPLGTLSSDLIGKDIALLQLESPMKGSPVSLFQFSEMTNLFEDRMVYIAGYGLAPDSGIDNGGALRWRRLSGVKADIIPEDNILSLNGVGLLLQALPKTCSGDSGGPLLVVEGEQVFVAGILSSASPDSSEKYPCGKWSYYAMVGKTIRDIKKLNGMKHSLAKP